MAGRPTALSRSVAEEIYRALRVGAPLRLAADSVAIPVKTVIGWRALGEGARVCVAKRCRDLHHGPRRGEVSYAEFAIEAQRAKGQAGLRAAASVSAQFQADPHYAERWIERNYPEDNLPGGEVDTAEMPTPPLIIKIEPQVPPEPESEATKGRSKAKTVKGKAKPKGKRPPE